MKFTRYKIWDPIYCYNKEDKSPRTREQLGHWLIFQQHYPLMKEFMPKPVSDLKGVSESSGLTFLLGFSFNICIIYIDTRERGVILVGIFITASYEIFMIYSGY